MSRATVLLVLVLAALCSGCALFGHRRGDLDVTLVGNHEVSAGDLEKAIDPALTDFSKSHFKRSAVDDAAYEIERAYNAAGFPFARVNYEYEEPAGAKPRARFLIEEGPRTELVEIVFSGNHAFGKRTLAPFFEAPQGSLFGTKRTYYDRGRVRSGAGDVERYYYTRGYLDVRVLEPAVVLDETRTRAVVTIRVEEGSRYELAEVTVEHPPGHEQDPPLDPELARAWQPYLGRPFFERIVLEVAGRIEDRYANRGHPSVRVELALRTATDEGRVRLVFTVDPGPRVRIGEVRIRGAEETRSSFVRSRLRLEEGDAYDRSKERESFRRLYQTGLFDNVDVRLATASEEEGAKPAEAPGAEAQASGTPPVDSTPGAEAPATQGAPAEAAPAQGPPVQGPPAPQTTPPQSAAPPPAAQPPAAQQPAAQQPAAPPPEAPPPAVPQPDAQASPTQAPGPQADAVRPLVIELREVDSLELFVQPGWGSYEQLRLSAGIRERNLFGTGRILRAEGSVSELAQSGRVGLTDPWFFGSDTVADLTLFGNNRQQPSFRHLELGSRIEFSRQFSRTFRGSFGYQYRRSDVTDVEVIDPEVQEALDEVDISSVFLSPTYDTRNNPFAPTKGTQSKLLLEFASQALGSELEFFRVQETLASFTSIDDDTVIGAGVQFGLIVPIATSDTIPLQERYFNGGENSVRSFQEDELGPKDASGEPLGGEAFSVISVELRRRVWRNVEVAVFYDLGNVVPQAEDFWGFQGYAEGIGLGLRYATPVGPIRLDGAINPDPGADEASGAIHFSIGMAF